MTKLSKELSFFDIYLFSIGYIIGAGIFVLIGKVNKYAKSLSWLSFILSGIFALIVATTYVDVNTLYTTNHSDYTFVLNTFGEIPAVITVLVLMGIGIFTNSTVALSIGNLLSPLISLSPIIISIGLILLFSGINCIGIKESSLYNHLSTFTEIFALLIISVTGIFFYKSKPSKYSLSNVKIPDLIYSTILAMFVYSGFEGTVKLTEEAKNPDDIPKAIIASVVSATILYVIVAYTVIKCCNTKSLYESSTPIVNLADIFFGSNISKIFYFITFISISNTLLISILGTSRILHSIAGEYSILKLFNKVDPTHKTPIYATICVAVCSILMLLFKDVEILASITSYLMFMIFCILNICLIHVYEKDEIQSKLKKNWTYTINQGKPILPIMGLCISLGMLGFGAYHHLG
tara:strand:+ start:2452 stop:3669 length:1218 start_codon:yes stop_codon:yes gene_type:complete